MNKSRSWIGVLGLCWAVIVTPVFAAEDQGPRKFSPEAKPVEHDSGVFSPDPTYEQAPYSPEAQIDIYGAKRALNAPRPLIELFRPIYREGPFQEGSDVVGGTNLVAPAFSIFGDLRTAVAYNDNGAKEVALAAARLNLDVDLRLTATERIHAFVRPIDQDGNFSRYEFAGGDEDDDNTSLDLNLETLFFEGDVGSILGGVSESWSDLDLPFAVGLTPLLFQNGVWVEDAFVGGAATWVAKNSRVLDISNMDVTVFAGAYKVSTPAARDGDGGLNDDDLEVFGVAAFVEANQGYWEAGYGFVEGDNAFEDIDYHSLTAAFTRRYGGWLSNGVRGILTFGQDRDGGAQQTADGFILLAENSLITSLPSTLVPYFNAFYGRDRPQPLADETGILKNTGINFETDALTGFPKLDDTGHDAFGGALGVEYLFALDRQVVVEAAAVRVIGGDSVAGRATVGDQYAIGARYQQPISAAWIARADAMYGFLDNTDDITGIRFELRRKF